MIFDTFYNLSMLRNNSPGISKQLMALGAKINLQKDWNWWFYHRSFCHIKTVKLFPLLFCFML